MPQSYGPTSRSRPAREKAAQGRSAARRFLTRLQLWCRSLDVKTERSSQALRDSLAELRQSWRDLFPALTWVAARKAAAFFGGVVAVALLAFTGLAALGRGDLPLAGDERIPIVPTDVADGGDLVAMAGGDGSARIYDRGRLVGIVSGHAAPVTQVLFSGEREVITLDARGEVRTSRWDPVATRALLAWREAGYALHDEVWTPLGRPAARRAFELAGRLFPIDVPQEARGRVVRTLDDGRMVELSPGWFFTGDPLIGSGGTEAPRRVVRIGESFAIQRSNEARLIIDPLPDGLLRAHFEPLPEAMVRASFEPAGAAVLTGGQATGDLRWRYRLPTRTEWEYAVRAGAIHPTLPRGFSDGPGELVRTCDTPERPTTLDAGCNRYALMKLVAGRMVAEPWLGRRGEYFRLRLVADPSLPPAGPAPVSVAEAPPPPFDGLAPRIYVQIADPAQRAAAREFEKRLEDTRIGGASLVVPGIELVRTAPRANILRCFTTDDCRRGRLLLEAANAILATPLALDDVTGRFDTARMRENHFEIWFAPGEITLRPAG